MKKICIILCIILFIIVFIIGLCFIVWNASKNYVLNNIQIDGVDEVEKRSNYNKNKK